MVIFACIFDEKAKIDLSVSERKIEALLNLLVIFWIHDKQTVIEN